MRGIGDGLGLALKRAGLLMIPEEREPPAVLTRAGTLAAENAARCLDEADALEALHADRALAEAHARMLPAAESRPRGAVETEHVLAQAKIVEAETLSEARAWIAAPKERMALLHDRALLDHDPRTEHRVLDRAPDPGARRDQGLRDLRRGRDAGREQLRLPGDDGPLRVIQHGAVAVEDLQLRRPVGLQGAQIHPVPVHPVLHDPAALHEPGDEVVAVVLQPALGLLKVLERLDQLGLVEGAYAGVDVAGKIAVVSRGECAFGDKAAAADAGVSAHLAVLGRPSCLVFATRDADGKVIDGNAETGVEVTDVWTFARTLGSRDPNWQLVATG